MSLARSERAALCDTFGRVSPDAPTLCGRWTTYDLAAHLVVRERRPLAAVGILVPGLAGRTEASMRALQREHPYPRLVELVRTGPPRWSPVRLPRIRDESDAVEFFVHHEDVRRAATGWTARELPYDAQRALWQRLRRLGRLLARRVPVGLEVVRTDSPDAIRLQPGEPPVIVRGLPSELTLFCFGRQRVADVEVSGDPASVEQLRTASLRF